MKLINNLLDYSQEPTLTDLFLFTGNTVVKKNGALVMGRGAAKEVRDSYPNIDKVFGKAITEHPTDNILWAPLTDPGHSAPNRFIGWFKVKHHWADNAELALISASVKDLTSFAEKFPKYTFHMNYPGIGNGGLAIEDVANLLKDLPDNVYIYGGSL